MLEIVALIREIVALIREIVNQVMGLFVQFHRSEDADFDSMETQVRSVMVEIGRRTLETIVRVGGTGYSGKRITTSTGEKARYVEIRSRTMGTLMGQVEIRRAYYHLGKGKGGYVPLVDMFHWMNLFPFPRSNTHMQSRSR